MNLLTKKTPWVAVSLLAAASVFGQQSGKQQQQKSFDQGHELGNMQMMAGYNAPARIDVRGAWDFYASASFTYWQPTQENMELAIVSDPAGNANTILNGNVVNLNFNFKPGFKVMGGMNFDHDNWDSSVQYTWFRGSHATSTSQASTGTAVVVPLWGIPAVNHNGQTYLNGSENWRLHMDLLDWDLGRSEYVGKSLSFRPFFGARAAWIRQRLSASYNTSTTTTLDVTQTSNSWAVGPRAGLYTNWMLGEGFRFYGNGAGDILFTQYTSLKDNQSSLISETTRTANVRQTNANTLRTHLELEIGFGWGTYFDNNNWHVDIVAGYTFQVFFDQNMFRHFEDDVTTGISTSPHGNLYMQGLVTSVRFDF